MRRVRDVSWGFQRMFEVGVNIFVSIYGAQGLYEFLK